MDVKYLKHTSKPEILASLIEVGICKEIENEDKTTSVVVTDAAKYALADVGVISEPTGKMVKTDFGEVPEMQPICDENGVPYYHFNLYSTVELPTLKYEVEAPKHPVNIML